MIEIKRATLDEETVKRLIELSFLWEKEDITYGLRHNERSDLSEICYIALNDKEIVGYIFGEYDENKTHQSFAKLGEQFFYISELYVHPDYRNQGIGKLLFNAIEEEVKDKATHITLSTATKDYKKILHFYTELGMSFHSAYLFKKLK